MSNFSALSRMEEVALDEMMSAFNWTKMLIWISIVLVHWNNSLWVDVPLHSWHIILIPRHPVFALTP